MRHAALTLDAPAVVPQTDRRATDDAFWVSLTNEVGVTNPDIYLVKPDEMRR